VFDGDNGPKYAAVRDSMNSAGVEFAFHMGDVKGGSSPCGELNYKRFEDLAMSLTIPSFLTIGGECVLVFPMLLFALFLCIISSKTTAGLIAIVSPLGTTIHWVAFL